MKRFQMLNSFVAAALLVIATAVAASAQVATIEGKLTLKQADGTEVPVQGATVDIHRTDISQKMGTVKTDKNGRYVRVGLPFTGTYTILVSAPGAAPDFLIGVRLNARTIYNFSLSPGDGRVLTLDELKKLAPAPGAPAAAAATPADSEEAKKQAAALAAERARIEKENAKAAELNVKLPDILKAGNDAFNAKNYDLAIAKYDEGIAADPEQSVFPRNKSLALVSRATPRYNAAVKAKDEAGKESARADLKAAVASSEKAVANFRANKAKAGGAAGSAPAGKPTEELGYLADRFEAYRLAFMTLTPIDNDAATKAIGEYVEMETDPAKKNKAQALLGEAYFNAGKVDESIAKFREILAANPGNVEAMRGLGISLAAKGAEDPNMLPEAIKTLEQFVAKSPDTDTRKQEATMMVEELKGTIKELANKPQPTQPNRGTRRRP